MSEDKMENERQTVFKEETSSETADKENEKTSTGLEENIAGMLTYLLGAITGIIFLLIEKDNRFVRFHALQSIFTFVVLLVLNTVLTSIPIIGWLIGLLLSPVLLVLWIVLMVQAYQGKWFKIPVIGNIVEGQLKRGEEE